MVFTIGFCSFDYDDIQSVFPTVSSLMVYTIWFQTFYGILYRDGPTSITIDGRKGDSLSILVENMGRVGYGSGITRGTKVRESFDEHSDGALVQCCS